MFVVKGKYLNRDVELTWDNGVLTGDPAAVQAIVEASGGSVTIPGWTWSGDLLDVDVSAYWLIERHLTEFQLVAGKLDKHPELDVPENAIP